MKLGKFQKISPGISVKRTQSRFRVNTVRRSVLDWLNQVKGQLFQNNIWVWILDSGKNFISGWFDTCHWYFQCYFYKVEWWGEVWMEIGTLSVSYISWAKLRNWWHLDRMNYHRTGCADFCKSPFHQEGNGSISFFLFFSKAVLLVCNAEIALDAVCYRELVHLIRAAP